MSINLPVSLLRLTGKFIKISKRSKFSVTFIVTYSRGEIEKKKDDLRVMVG